MSSQAYAEFKEIKNVVGSGKNTLIVGRQDLRLLSSWEFGSKGMAEYLFTVDELKNYDRVYLIRQIAGSHLNENSFVQAEVPAYSRKVFQGAYFELYDLRDIQAWRYGKGRPSFAAGKVLDGEKGRYRIANGLSGRIKTIQVSEKTKMQLLKTDGRLKKGMQVQVWGHYRPFGLTILAEVIEEY